jgi:hypothetical protein
MTLDQNRQPKGTETGGQFAPSSSPESAVNPGVIDVHLGYIFDDVRHPGTFTLVPNSISDVETVAPTQ